MRAAATSSAAFTRGATSSARWCHSSRRVGASHCGHAGTGPAALIAEGAGGGAGLVSATAMRGAGPVPDGVDGGLNGGGSDGGFVRGSGNGGKLAGFIRTGTGA